MPIECVMPRAILRSEWLKSNSTSCLIFRSFSSSRKISWIDWDNQKRSGIFIFVSRPFDDQMIWLSCGEPRINIHRFAAKSTEAMLCVRWTHNCGMSFRDFEYIARVSLWWTFDKSREFQYKPGFVRIWWKSLKKLSSNQPQEFVESAKQPWNITI
jgi:hypothetical protein